MKRLLVVAVMAMVLTGCATPIQHIELTQADMAGMHNDTVVMCAYAGDLPPHAGMLESDPNGYCKTEAMNRLKDGRMSRDEYQLDLDSAKGAVQQATAVAIEQSREAEMKQEQDDRDWNAVGVASAICNSRPWGC